MTWSRKRKATNPASKIEELLNNQLEGNAQELPEVLASKLSSGQREEQIQACALLCSLDIPLDVLLEKGQILNCLTACMDGEDAGVAAEAASVLRTWTNMSGNRPRLLYAHCLLPKILQQFGKFIPLLENITKLDKGRIVLLEHHLVSILLVCWSFVEEIPASIKQVNESALVLLSCLVLEKKAFLTEDILVVLLQLLLCAVEENESELLREPSMRIRLESLLQRHQQETAMKTHSGLLAFGLFHYITGGFTEADLDPFTQLLADEKDLNDLGMLRDLLEILTNAISELEFTEPKDALASALMRRLSMVLGQSDEIADECMQRGLNCLMNLILAQPSPLTYPAIQTVWQWSLRKVLPSREIPPVAVSELLRNIVLICFGEFRLDFAREDMQLIRGICSSNIDDDALLGNLVSIPAILDKDASGLAWMYEMIQVLFDPSRPIRTILAVAEILEELHNRQLVDQSLKEFIESRRTSVLSALRGNDMELEEDLPVALEGDLPVEPERDLPSKDELEYVITTIDAITEK